MIAGMITVSYPLLVIHRQGACTFRSIHGSTILYMAECECARPSLRGSARIVFCARDAPRRRRACGQTPRQR